MENLNEEMRKLIDKTLPNEVGKVLRDRLEQADNDAQKVSEQNAQIQSLVRQVGELNALIEKHKALDIREVELAKKEKELVNIDQAAQTTRLLYELSVEKEKSQFCKEVALGLVRNIEYRRKIMDNVNQPGGTDQYGNIVYTNKTQNLSETTKAE